MLGQQVPVPKEKNSSPQKEETRSAKDGGTPWKKTKAKPALKGKSHKATGKENRNECSPRNPIGSAKTFNE